MQEIGAKDRLAPIRATISPQIGRYCRTRRAPVFSILNALERLENREGFRRLPACSGTTRPAQNMRHL